MSCCVSYGYGSITDAIAAAGTCELVFTQITSITSNTTFTCPVRLDGNASFNIATGVTVTFAKKFSCGLRRAFTLSGSAQLVFDAKENSVGYPEWWGAVPNGPDCVSALEACFAALPVTQLQAADYWCSRTPIFATEQRLLEGIASHFEGAGAGATRIVVSSATAHGMQVGPTTQPSGGINSFPSGMRFRNFQVTRSVAPNIASGCIGVLNQYTLYARFENVRATESMKGYEFIGTVQTFVDDCYAFRSSAGSGGGADYFRAFYVNGNASIGAAGSNASLYINRSTASIGGLNITDSIGFYIDGNFSDLFLTAPETSGCAIPIHVVGNNSSSANFGNVDLSIANPVLDGFGLYGIYLKNIGKYGAVNISGGYAAASTANTVVSGIRVENCTGAINLGGMQVIGGLNAFCGGIYATDSANLRTNGNMYLDCARGPIYLNAVVNSQFRDTIKNNNLAADAGVTLLAGCERNQIDCILSGAADKLGIGVNVIGTSNSYNEINATSIDAACIDGGQANKININAVQITAAGVSGTNLISGINNTTFVQNFATLNANSLTAASIVAPTIVGGSSTTQTLSFQTTTGVGVNGANHVFKVGNNGALIAMSILNSGETVFSPGGAAIAIVDGTGISAGGFGANGGLLNARSNSNRYGVVMQYAASDSLAASLVAVRNRGTVTLPSALTLDDNALEVAATTWDGSANRNLATLFFSADAAHSAGSTPGRISCWTTPAGSNALVERWRTNSAGNTGFGVTTVTAVVHIKAGTQTLAPLKLTASNNLLTTVENGAFEFDGTYLYFTVGGVRKIVNLV